MGNSRKKIALAFIPMIAASLGTAFSQEPVQKNNLSRYAFSGSDRDPFSSLISKNGLILIPRETDVTNMSLSGIIYSEGESVAIINNEVVKVGDTIGAYKVLTIEEKKVILEKDNQGFTLKLEE